MAKRKDIPRPHNGGEWTVSRYNSFVKAALRKARWPVKYKVLKSAYVRDGINPATGRKCKLHQCIECKQLFPQKDIQIDHIEPIVPTTGFTNWDDVITRMFCEEDNLQPLCRECHKIKSGVEREERKAYKDTQKEKTL